MRIEPLHEEENLSLTTAGHLEVFFIGTGNAFARTLGNTNLLFIKGQDHLLVDFGITGPDRLLKTAGLLPTDIDALFLTHAHADHCGGTEQLAFMNRFIAKKKPVLWAPEPLLGPLWNNTLSGGMKYLTGIKDPLRLGDYFRVKMPYQDQGWPNEHYSFNHGDMQIELFSTDHIEEPHDEPSFKSYGIVIDDRVFYSSDSIFNPNLIEKWSHCETLFHDCSIYPSGGTHAELDELRSQVRPEIKKKMRLVHYADNYKDHDVSDFAGWTESGMRYIYD